MSSLARFVVLFNCNQTCLSRMWGVGVEGSLSTVSKGKQRWRAGETTLMTDFISNDFYGAYDCVCEQIWTWLEDKFFFFLIDLNVEEAVHLTRSFKSTHFSSISVVKVFFKFFNKKKKKTHSIEPTRTYKQHLDLTFGFSFCSILQLCHCWKLLPSSSEFINWKN